MRVLVTGGGGRVGKATTRRLIDNGWDVRVIGLEERIDILGAEFVRCDILNYDDVRAQMRGCQAVIHLAAIPSPHLAPGHQVFDSNVSGTFHVFEAASAEGIRRIAYASSINALGGFYGNTEMVVQYLPVDESHPTYTTDPYSFAKGMIEQIGEYYWRRDGISSVALRFPGVRQGGWTGNHEIQRQRKQACRIIDELAALPDEEATVRIDKLRQEGQALRRTRPLEFKDSKPNWDVLQRDHDPLWGIYIAERFNLWAIIDDRDAAQALEKGLTADYEGAHALFVNDSHNALLYDAKTLARLFFPDVSTAKINLSDMDALVSIDKARKLIGFEPAYSVSAIQQEPHSPPPQPLP